MASVPDGGAPGAPPPAYPHPLRLPPAPAGDPAAARELATAYRQLAVAVDVTVGRATAVLRGLAAEWAGQGAAARQAPLAVLAGNGRQAAEGLREVADRLDRYADELAHAQHHHGFSLGRLFAIGAVVVVAAAAVVVTVGAAAPLGSAAAVEVGEAVAGAEAAVAGAAAAQAQAAGALVGAGRLFAGMRALLAALGPHLAAGAANAGFDAVAQQVGHGAVDPREVAESAVLGAVASGAGAAALTGVRATAAYAGASAYGRIGWEAAAAGGAQAGVEAGRLWFTGRPLSLEQVLEGGLAGAAFHVQGAAAEDDGWLGVRRRARRPTRPVAPQPIDELAKHADLARHESRRGGADGLGHTIARHVGKSVAWLRQRLADEPGTWTASTFADLRTAEYAVSATVRAHLQQVRHWLESAPMGAVTELDKTFEQCLGTVVKATGDVTGGYRVRVVLRKVSGGVVVHTAYLFHK